MATTDRSSRADLLLYRRAGRIADELDRTAADGWLVYDFRGSNPAFSRLLGSPGDVELMVDKMRSVLIPLGKDGG